MNDQGSITGGETPSQKYQRALDLFIESVMAPDHKLRSCAHNQHCYDELMEIRKHVLEYLKTLKDTTSDEESDIMKAKTLQFMRDNIPSRY